MKLIKKIVLAFTVLAIGTALYASPFNDKLTADELGKLNNGEVLIKNINIQKNMSLASGTNQMADNLINSIKALNPKYLAEVIQVKPYEGNEDLPQRLEELLLNVSEYAGIPYWSERKQWYYPLYSSAEITDLNENEDIKIIKANLEMSPFGTINQKITINSAQDCIYYFSENENNLIYDEKISCVGAKKMNMDILLFRDGDNWILYGIGGVNAPRIPFFTERIETSFINRIKTFCNFVFTKLSDMDAITPTVEELNDLVSGL